MKEENINFEEEMKKLEEIANSLESGNLNLDESIKKFEEGMEISKNCNSYLENAEKKITMIINDGDNIKEENFEAEE